MNKRDQAIEVGIQMLNLMNTRQTRKFEILDRRFQRLVKSQDSVEDIDYILEELRQRFPNENKPGGVLYPKEEAPKPTLEQCENAALALGLPILIEGLRPPYYEESMRNLHAIIAKCAMGDEEACEKIAFFKRAFGRKEGN